MDEARMQHLQMIQGAIERMAQCSFQLKGWAVTLVAALEVFLKGETRPEYLFVPVLPVIAFWLLDAWYLRQERRYRLLFDHVRAESGDPGFSMDTSPFHATAPSLLRAAGSPTLLGLYGPLLVLAVALAFILPSV